MILQAAPPNYNVADQDRMRQLIMDALTRIETKLASWQGPTGTATRTTFDTATVTLPQLAERVKALIDDLQAVI